MSESPLRFDKYELLGSLGKGGMGAVFKARAFGPHGFQKVVALKRVLPELARDADFQERFAAEARVAALLRHANIVQVFDFGAWGDELFLVMEHIHGCTLDHLLGALAQSGRSLSVPQALSVVLEVARALDYAHRFRDASLHISGVVHRDVSPSNILLSRSGEVKLTDFGVAQLLGRSGPTDIAGKERYMAPEQARGLPLDGRADLYALGVVLYMSFAGQEEKAHSAAVTPSLQSPRAGLPPASMPTALASLVTRLTQQDRDARPASAEALIREVLQVSYDNRFVLDPLELGRLTESLAPPDPEPSSGPEDDVLVAERPARGLTVVRAQPRRTVAMRRSGGTRRPLAIVSGAVLLGIVGGAGIAVTWRSTAPLPEGVEDRRAAPSPPPAVVAQPPEPAPSLAGPAETDPPKSAAPQRAPPPDARPRPRARAAPAPAAAQPEAFGSLNVFSTPWAELWLDGQRLPDTAPVRGLKVPVGRHHLKLVHPPSGASAEQDIEVARDQTVGLNVELQK